MQRVASGLLILAGLIITGVGIRSEGVYSMITGIFVIGCGCYVLTRKIG
jgi:hypothetical protein